jgi:hypothetical protein
MSGTMVRVSRKRAVLVALAVLGVAAIAAAVSAAFLTQHAGGRGLPAVSVAPAETSLRQPPAPPKGALVLAREAGVYAVALAAQPKRLTATVLAPSGNGARGLHVSFVLPQRRLVATTSCGLGCYRADVAARGTRVGVRIGSTATTFTIPRATPAARSFVRRATRAFANLHSVVYREHLASSPTLAIDTLWRLEAPNRMTYAIRNGSDAVVIGTSRWDRAQGGRWVFSTITALRLPSAPWGSAIVDAHVLSRDGDTVVVSWVNPDIPAWFTGRFDARTALPRTLAMTAAAHFMLHRYLSFNRPLAIRPPTR